LLQLLLLLPSLPLLLLLLLLQLLLPSLPLSPFACLQGEMMCHRDKNRAARLGFWMGVSNSTRNGPGET
jgi:hypothetical protein